MGTDLEDVISSLRGTNWSQLSLAIEQATAWLLEAPPGHSDAATVAAEISKLGWHPKWEVRRAVAVAASKCPHEEFGEALASLRDDKNLRVKEAAELARAKAKDRRRSGAFARGHKEKVDRLLDRADAMGAKGARAAVTRLATQIANTFAKEVHHEVARLLSPLLLASERLRTAAGDPRSDRGALMTQAEEIERLVRRIGAVMNAMREYAHEPTLRFGDIRVDDLIKEAVGVVRARRDNEAVPVVFEVGATVCEVDRERLFQAIVNVVANACDASRAAKAQEAVVVRCRAESGTVTIEVEDHGTGMSAEAVQDSVRLFVTTKPEGTGFGLPLAMKIVEEEHNGRLQIASRPGRGTNVAMAIPARRASRG